MPGSDYAPGMLRQLRAFAARQIQGMPRFGWKIGINVPEVQRKLGLSHSLVGFLDGERVFASDAAIHVPTGARLHLEPELCLTLGQNVDAAAGMQVARAAIALVQPAFELLDYSKPTNSLDELAAHSMFHYGVILGDEQPRPTVELMGGLPAQLLFEVGDQCSPPARADLVPVELAEVVLLVARVLAEFGETLRAGDRIMSGAFVERALPLLRRQAARARFGALGEVRCHASDG